MHLSGNIILNDQPWTGGYTRVSTVQAKLIGEPVVVIVQFEAQANLRKTTVGGKLVDINFGIGQIDVIPASCKSRRERAIGF